MSKEELCYGTGRRKTSVARVRLYAGTGEITINGRPSSEFFRGRDWADAYIRLPFTTAQNVGKFDVVVRADGGGFAGQAGAIQNGIARALVAFDSKLRKALRKAGLMTRDPRMKERKKYGQRGARARFQFSKR